eukprot:scaffold205079_cov14-Tisochrysis_lutea.AAC.1
MPKTHNSADAYPITSQKRMRTSGQASAKGKRVLISDPIEQVVRARGVSRCQRANLCTDTPLLTPRARLGAR